MNSGAATAFLPNFVGFPSPRGLHSSTVHVRRAPPCAPPPAGRAASAPSAAAAPARRTAGGAAAAGVASPARVTSVTTAVTTTAVTARGRVTARVAGPPAAAACRVPGRAGPLPLRRTLPTPRGDEDAGEQKCHYRKDDAERHGATLPSNPPSAPGRSPISLEAVRCRAALVGAPALCAREMPSRRAAQSEVEQLLRDRGLQTTSNSLPSGSRRAVA